MSALEAVWAVLVIVLVVLMALAALALSGWGAGDRVQIGGGLEVEKVYFGFDEDAVKDRIMRLGGRHEGKFLFRHVRFAPPRADLGVVRARVRDEGRRVTMTVKRRPAGARYDTEDEVIVDDFDRGVGLMEALGARKMYYLEKTRDIYRVGAPSGAEAEVVFDSYPGLPACLEIEAGAGLPLASAEADVAHVERALGLPPGAAVDTAPDAGDMYLGLYGITKARPLTDLTFGNAHDTLGPLVTKNGQAFSSLLQKQRTEMPSGPV